ncbi:MAG: CBS domain-containing protein [Gammaproteobacteria bacterium]|nr:CBS domain-containing protein [Gammaproteobacteria bacterium]MCW5584029.1 CBS domain-containing protein [Gammaproteobacteria bacterium]
MTEKREAEKIQIKSRSWLERLAALLAGEPQNRDQLMEVLRDAEERDVLSTEMLGMIERILQVSEMQVREVMVPKAQMITIENHSTLEKLLPIVIESGHSRFPVFDPVDGDIVGMLLAKDILQFFFHQNAEEFNMSRVIRPPVFIPQSKRLDILLREFRINRNHIAIVLDEYGHVAGLVTIEDVLEQIVGEIEDEYDMEEDDIYIKKHDDDTYIVKAKTPIDEFNVYFHSDFSDEEYDTIGGLIFKHFAHLPKRGESLKLNNYRFKVLHSDNRRIYLLEVKKIKKKM